MSNSAGLGAPPSVALVNQVAVNVAHHPGEQAVASAAAHLRACWARFMRAELFAYLDVGGTGLSPLAAAAADELRATTTRSPAE